MSGSDTQALGSDLALRGIFDAAKLDTCISCGYCLPACPTYQNTRVEASSPRGRINLMRALEAGQLEENDPTLQHQVSLCLGCRACEPACPAGVLYGDLLEQWRDHQWRGGRAPRIVRLLMRLTGLPGPLLSVQRVARRYRRTKGVVDARTTHYLLGCVERGLFPEVSHAVAEVLPGTDAPAAQGCCGALHAHNGQSAWGARLAERLGGQLPGTILTSSGGCAAHLAQHLGRDRVVEVSEAAGKATAGGTTLRRLPLRTTLQDSCHLRNGLGVAAEPRTLLSQISDYVELPSAGTCCGAAGTYSFLQPIESRQLIEAKIAEALQLNVDIIVVNNPGCLRQYRLAVKHARASVRVEHIAVLLAEAGRPSTDTARPGRRKT